MSGLAVQWNFRTVEQESQRLQRKKMTEKTEEWINLVRRKMVRLN